MGHKATFCKEACQKIQQALGAVSEVHAVSLAYPTECVANGSAPICIVMTELQANVPCMLGSCMNSGSPRQPCAK